MIFIFQQMKKYCVRFLLCSSFKLSVLWVDVSKQSQSKRKRKRKTKNAVRYFEWKAKVVWKKHFFACFKPKNEIY